MSELNPTSSPTALDPDRAAQLQASMSEQGMLLHLGAAMTWVEAGEVEITLPFSERVTQQHGYFHGAAVTSVVDSACGYAAMTLLEPGVEVLSIEFKVNFMAPAQGTQIRAVGRVVKSGRRISICEGDVYAVDRDGAPVHCARMLTSIMHVRKTNDEHA
jgi:uncharacterized protein (TIGR00369 family)